MNTRDQAVQVLENRITILNKVIGDWAKELQDNPVKSFEWADTVISTSVELELLKQYQDRLFAIENQQDWLDLRDMINNELLSLTTNVNNSTSLVHNAVRVAKIQELSYIMKGLNSTFMQLVFLLTYGK